MLLLLLLLRIAICTAFVCLFPLTVNMLSVTDGFEIYLNHIVLVSFRRSKLILMMVDARNWGHRSYTIDHAK